MAVVVPAWDFGGNFPTSMDHGNEGQEGGVNSLELKSRAWPGISPISALILLRSDSIKCKTRIGLTFFRLRSELGGSKLMNASRGGRRKRAPPVNRALRPIYRGAATVAPSV